MVARSKPSGALKQRKRPPSGLHIPTRAGRFRSRYLQNECDSVPLLGAPARIDADENWADPVEVEGPWDTHAEWEMAGALREVRAACHAVVTSLMAGEEAEIEILGKCSYEQDAQHVTFILDDLYSEKECFRWEKKLRGKARRLVRKHRAAIATVSEMLMQHGMVSTEEVDGIISRMRAVKTAESPELNSLFLGLAGSLPGSAGRPDARSRQREASPTKPPIS